VHLYVHIPFCRQNCAYCDFYFSLNKRHEQSFFDALRRELRERAVEIRRYGPLQTVYFGGGTPSYARPAFLRAFLDEVRRLVEVMPGAEITLEANPDDITPEILAEWRSMGINRLSVGVQSFRDEDLRLMNRSHDAATTVQALEWLVKYGWDNVNIDLIYGIPGLDRNAWNENIRRFLGYGFPHLSAYALTVEPGTLLHHQVRKGRLRMPADEEYEQQFFDLIDRMKQAGYQHYEISNWARPDFVSRHNTAYWQGHPYSGLGPSAHSYDGHRKRRWNVANLHRYIRGLEKGERYYETETLSDRDLYNEYILTGLRTAEGVDKEVLRQRFPSFYTSFLETAHALAGQNLLAYRQGRWYVPKPALFRTDGIIERFFVV